MVSKPFKTKIRAFSKKGDATEFYRAILYAYKIGDRVSDDHAAELLALLEFHPERDDKLRQGVDHFEVMDDGWNKQCFKIVYPDGAWDDFSFPTCITNAS